MGCEISYEEEKYKTSEIHFFFFTNVWIPNNFEDSLHWNYTFSDYPIISCGCEIKTLKTKDSRQEIYETRSSLLRK
jgi:hypothetical protein